MSAMKSSDAASCLATLGNETRLSIFRLLVKSGDDGLPVGRIQTKLGLAASTLSHHIAALVADGLVDQQREGRTLVCKPNFARMNALLSFLTEDCCQGTCGELTRCP
jgi:DNA-binding transcriptional ArsR family regulator